ncbi:MAG: hypothetical protein WC721_18100 [Victivallaceae bacterium]|jgi:hypothetical protein
MKMTTLLCAASLSCLTAWAGEVNIIANSDFEKVDENNVVANWKAGTGSRMEVVGEGVNGSKVLRTYSTIKVSNVLYRGSICQKFPDLTAGKYVLSGEFKGALGGLYLVVIYNKDASSKFAKWISADRFVKTEEAGWFKFSEPLEVPADTKDALLVIETYQLEKDQYTDLDNVKLIKQEDKK